MKLVILGGSGDMGSFIVRDAAKFGEVWTHITIADIDEKRSKKLMAEINDPRINYEPLEIFKQPEPFTPSIMARYGFTFLILSLI